MDVSSCYVASVVSFSKEMSMYKQRRKFQEKISEGFPSQPSKRTRYFDTWILDFQQAYQIQIAF
jgi:hypothetical protein